MPNPLSGLKPALEVLAQNVDILPATGQAVEDLLRPDQEEVEDTVLTKDDTRVDTLIERPNRELYVPTPSLPRTEQHVFRYFLDGSQRSYFLGTAVERERSSPIQLAQIGAAAVVRQNDGQVRKGLSDHRYLLLAARDQFSDQVWQALEGAFQAGERFRLENIAAEDEDQPELPTGSDLRSQAVTKAGWRMHEMEVELAQRIASEADEGDWLVIDGSVRYKALIRLKQTVGVAKSFSKAPRFQIGRGPRVQSLNIMQLLAALEAGHRTCAFSAQSGQVAFWYVRLREQGMVDYPLMGVIKVTLPNPSGEPVSSDLVDHLSRALVAERHVTPHGRDTRWHVHLYPIYLAEQVIKNGFLSQEVIRNAIHWPTIAGMTMRR